MRCVSEEGREGNGGQGKNLEVYMTMASRGLS